jgi:uncharacterized protein with HEPN domain
VAPTVGDRVRHILVAIEDINRALAAKSLAAFTSDRLLRLAIERLLEIVCEASRHIPDDVKATGPNVPWQRMVDFGNRLRHAYHGVDPDIVWNIVHDELPAVKSFVERVIREEEERPA